MIYLETERMIFRAHRENDLEAYCAIEADPLVRQFAGGMPRAYEDAKRRFLNGLSVANEPLTLRAIELKADGNYIGRAGLYPHFGPDGAIQGEASISFYLAPQFWGRGLATEAGRVFVNYGFSQAGLRRIVSIIDARNERSRRVLEKLGFQLAGSEPGIRQFDSYQLVAT